MFKFYPCLVEEAIMLKIQAKIILCESGGEAVVIGKGDERVQCSKQFTLKKDLMSGIVYCCDNNGDQSVEDRIISKS